MDLKLGADGDLDLDASGDIQTVTGRDAIAQHALIRCRFFLGEWFLDEREGVPYYERILVANPNLPDVEEAFRRTIAETPGMASVRSLSLDFDRSTRSIAIEVEAVTTEGELITSADFGPFII